MAGTICSPTQHASINRCSGDADCAGHPGGAVCDDVSGACVQCVASSDTCSPEPHCDPMSNACVAGCRSDEGCPPVIDGDDAGPGVQLHCNVATRVCEACVTDAPCPTGPRCSAGACVRGCADDSRCAAGERCCGGACVNPQSNDQNCGACGRVCAAPTGGSATCTGGVCGSSCPAGATNCSGVCRDLQTDTANCGACGRACGASQACVNAVCVGQGSLRFTMTWDTNGDMDMHLLPPCGTEIYYGRLSACGGTLDRDDTSVRGPENIFWSGSFTPGTYRVCPEAYTSAVANALYTLTVVRNGVTVHTSSARRGRTDGNTACTASFPGVVTLSQ